MNILLQMFQSSHKQTRRAEKNFFWLKKAVLLALLVSLSVSFLWGYNKLTSPETFPVAKVEVIDPAQHVPEETIKSLILPLVREGFFGVSVTEIRNRLQALPWISHVVVSRRWPNTVIIQIDEQQPVARWNENGVLVSSGGVFYPDDGYFPPNLPVLKGPTGNELTILSSYQEFQTELATAGLTIKELDESSREAFDIYLTNGIHLLLGKEDAKERLHRFVDVYTEVFAGRESKVQYVDMRYNNGMAVKWL